MIGYYNKELDKLFNITSFKDVIKRPDLAAEEIVFPRPWFATIPYEHQWWLSCSICLGLILIDKRKDYQERPCEKCKNLFKVRRTGRGGFKYQFITGWRHPQQERMTRATM